MPEPNPTNPADPVISDRLQLADALARHFLANADAHRDSDNDELVAQLRAWQRREATPECDKPGCGTAARRDLDDRDRIVIVRPEYDNVADATRVPDVDDPTDDLTAVPDDDTAVVCAAAVDALRNLRPTDAALQQRILNGLRRL
ncbi:MAG: hypothetical protein ACRDRL_02900 [Sciscionella sp.]